MKRIVLIGFWAFIGIIIISDIHFACTYRPLADELDAASRLEALGARLELSPAMRAGDGYVEVVDLSGVSVQLKDLLPLFDLSHLRRLNVTDTPLSEGDIRWLREEFPDVKIVH